MSMWACFGMDSQSTKLDWIVVPEWQLSREEYSTIDRQKSQRLAEGRSQRSGLDLEVSRELWPKYRWVTWAPTHKKMSPNLLGGMLESSMRRQKSDDHRQGSNPRTSLIP